MLGFCFVVVLTNCMRGRRRSEILVCSRIAKSLMVRALTQDVKVRGLSLYLALYKELSILPFFCFNKTIHSGPGKPFLMKVWSEQAYCIESLDSDGSAFSNLFFFFFFGPEILNQFS